MKILTSNQHRFALLTSALLFIACTAHAAAPKDKDEPIHVNADLQQFDLMKNISTFTGNVNVTRGATKISANKAVVTQSADGTQQVVEAFGNPVKFSTKLESGKVATGHSSKLKYEAQLKRVTLTGNAQLKQADSQITGEVITYQIDKQIMNVSGNKKQRVSSTLYPAQLKDVQKR